MLCFAIAPWVGKPALAIANICLIWGSLSISLLFRSWRQALKMPELSAYCVALVILAIAYLLLLSYSSTSIRIHYLNLILASLSLWQIYELSKQLKVRRAFQIKVLFGVILLQLTVRLIRSADLLLEFNGNPSTIFEEGVFGFLLRISSVLLILLTCVLIANYFLEIIWRGHKQNSELLEKAMLSSLNALSMARDNETGNHILRTQSYVAALANRLHIMNAYPSEITPLFLSNIANAAPLHDIGKVGIPDEILKKGVSLTESEWVTMKTHASLGENVLNAAKVEYPFHSTSLDLAIDIAGGHHECWDGSGYPRGLTAENIPLAARIMSLADMYDALVSERVYKARWSHEDAVKEILAGQGKFFDPLVVEAFLLEQTHFRDISLKYQD
ncbi:HD-GYP domain-containing protein [Polynucleobacter sp. CS-Odin-A6]|uniref:HD-GYP domain-containing protein n=1 Tax=Polynucleobacter sp. CS-Odin-A6 TaxID=2689106 RepID=UPI001C0E5012|nr:HD domain-containing phosphohydrolase [Polynucleobacter sp. CS-Odin-A6]MBU3621908.1 HD domain-containing protein [Polynucleobacter sp. CS-Odin-A6]